MDFGRIDDLRKLDQMKWELPSLNSNEELLQKERLQKAGQREKKVPSIFVGTPVWGEAEWVGALFPPATKSDHYLKEYAKQFSTVEVNSTFYAIPSEETFIKWADAVPGSFRFCPKFPQSISRSLAHEANLSEFDVFLQRLRILDQKLGCSFLQLPPDLTIQSLNRLNVFFSKIPREAKAMVEFRHESFFSERRLKPEVIQLLASHRLGTVITDTAQFRSMSHVSLSSTRLLLRFAASNGHPSDFVRVDQWVERLSMWMQNGLNELFVSVHAKLTLPQIEVARYFIQKWNEQIPDAGLKLPEPVFYHELQGSLF